MKIPTPSEFRETFNSPVWQEIAEAICRAQNVAYSRVSRASGTDSVVFFIDDRFVLKIYAPLRNVFEREKSGLEFAAGKTSLHVPEIHSIGRFEHYDFLIMTRISGRLMTRQDWLQTERGNQIGVLEQLAIFLKELHSFEAPKTDFDWNSFLQRQIDATLERQRSSGATQQWLDALPEYLERNISLIPSDARNVFMHADVHFGNLGVIEDGKKLRVAGIYDLSDSRVGFHEYEFVAPGVLMIQGQGELQREFFRAYGYPDNKIDEELRTRLMLMTILYETSGLRRYAARLRPEAADYSLDKLEREIWSFLEI